MPLLSTKFTNLIKLSMYSSVFLYFFSNLSLLNNSSYSLVNICAYLCYFNNSLSTLAWKYSLSFVVWCPIAWYSTRLIQLLAFFLPRVFSVGEDVIPNFYSSICFIISCVDGVMSKFLIGLFLNSSIASLVCALNWSSSLL